MRRWVEDRADRRCEYCGIPQEKEPFFRFHVDHIIARQHGGETTTTNLALACHFCNRHKGPNLSSIDPLTANIEALFNPRSDVWLDHFELAGDKVLGRTPTGRATVSLLRMNAPNRRALR
jgi:5-methylcytosine-specific restriction endonuclease McrA